MLNGDQIEIKIEQQQCSVYNLIYFHQNPVFMYTGDWIRTKDISFPPYCDLRFADHLYPKIRKPLPALLHST